MRCRCVRQVHQPSRGTTPSLWNVPLKHREKTHTKHKKNSHSKCKSWHQTAFDLHNLLVYLCGHRKLLFCVREIAFYLLWYEWFTHHLLTSLLFVFWYMQNCLNLSLFCFVFHILSACDTLSTQPSTLHQCSHHGSVPVLRVTYENTIITMDKRQPITLVSPEYSRAAQLILWPGWCHGILADRCSIWSLSGF